MKIFYACLWVTLFAMLWIVSGASGEENFIKVKVSEIIRAKLGSGPDDICICTPREANPEGTKSFALDERQENAS
ncbi:MAG: hypothetical protein ACUVUQ_00615 [Thermodesulfovibrionales bacterium]